MDDLTTPAGHQRSVDHAADRVAYLVVSFGLLAVVIYRSFVLREASWDLLGLVILGGAFGTAYRIRQYALDRREWLVLAGAVGVAVVVAAIVVFTARA